MVLVADTSQVSLGTALLRGAVGWTAIGVVALLGIAILWKIIDGSIDLRNVISDAGGTASMSRFQLLIFTFVVGLAFLYLVMADGTDRLPDIPGSVLTLLGISGSSYLVSKSIDKGVGKQPAAAPPPPPPTAPHR